MDDKDLGSITGWVAVRLPVGWFSVVEGVVVTDQTVLIGALA